MGDAMRYSKFSIWKVVHCPTGEFRPGAEFTVTHVHEPISGKRSEMVANWIPGGTVFYEGEFGRYMIATKDRTFQPIPWVGCEDKQTKVERSTARPQYVDIFPMHTKHTHGITHRMAVKIG